MCQFFLCIPVAQFIKCRISFHATTVPFLREQMQRQHPLVVKLKHCKETHTKDAFILEIQQYF